MPGGIQPTRQDTYTVNVQVAHPTTGNMIDYGTFDKMSGGEVDSDQAQYYPGGMEPPVALGGRRTTGNVTVSRNIRIGRDWPVIGQLNQGVGRSKMIVTKHIMSIEGGLQPRPLVYTGVLKRVTPAEVDSESSSAGMLELEMAPEGFPAQS